MRVTHEGGLVQPVVLLNLKTIKRLPGLSCLPAISAIRISEEGRLVMDDTMRAVLVAIAIMVVVGSVAP
jgi:hypothetical protein